MDGKKADMVFTDPPYGMAHSTAMSAKRYEKDGWVFNPRHYDPVVGDHDDFKDELITTIFSHFDSCKEIFIWGADYFAELIPERKSGSFVVWDKRAGIEESKWSTSEFELCWSKARHHRGIARVAWVGIIGTEQEHDHASGRRHPTQKPVKLVSWFFERWGNEGDTVVDLYGGSGPTLLACEKYNRACYTMELLPMYCDVIVQRWESLTGEKAELVRAA